MPAGPYADWKFVCDYNNSYYDFIGFHLDGASEATSKLLYAEGPSNNVKTLFGNQSIYGSGNIDLYRHNITVSLGGAPYANMYILFISSSSLVVDSLTDFFTLAGAYGSEIPASGLIYDTSNGFIYTILTVEPNASGGINTFSFAESSTRFFTWSSLSPSFSDTVTTV